MINVFKWMSLRTPDLPLRLMKARIPETPEFYIKKTVMTSLYTSLGLCFIAFLFINNIQAFIALPLFFLIAYFYFYHFVDFRIKKYEKEVNRELVFAGRFLTIELESGVPLFTAFENMSKNYQYVGLYFAEVIEKVSLGTAMDDAINEVSENCPSNNLRKIFWQILNSLKTGSDISKSLMAVVDQLVKEQEIMVKEYGKKLSPLAMFYMMIAIIVPTLGIMMIVVLATFVGFSLSLTMLIVIALVIGFFQFMFLGAVRSNRPPVDM